MAKQNIFNFSFDESFSEHDFIVSSCNEDAFNFINSWPNWQTNAALIYGDKASGKTHLANIWQGKNSAKFVNLADIDNLEAIGLITESNDCIILEDIDKANNEIALFHLMNHAKEQGCSVLFTASCHPSMMNIRLPDLRSRLHAINCIKLDIPDEFMMKILLTKGFINKQIKISEDVVDFIVTRMERSFVQIKEVVEKIDQSSLEEKRNITIPFIRSIFNI
ncbi:DnaA/Hda family protein [Rickettsiales bacterium]|nr:DnaA/Hda family protein [Rickettsiales bacterium]